MIAASSELSIMLRRCLLTFKPFRIFVVGIGFFSLCFLMTSLGGQFSAKRPGDSPFTMRAEGKPAVIHQCRSVACDFSGCALHL
uniref:Alpha-1,6-mannosylglycoprotein 6-beta-N-acetylglucosaminyltransferase B n=1 Tax=Oreochromis niloticus TaxID=8128 RepID=A0A669DTH0_ORENI